MTDAEGWGWPMLARKAHYFVDATSLCRKWWYTGNVATDVQASPDDCAMCKRLLRNRTDG